MWLAKNTIKPTHPAQAMDALLATYMDEGYCSALRSEHCVDKYVGDFIISNKSYDKYVK